LGEFVWTGFDYLGEPTPYNKDQTNLLNFTNPAEAARMKQELEKIGSNIPPRSSYFGIVDLCGFPKDRFYLYQSRWQPERPMAHILPHWNWPERIGKVTPVHVYTSGDEAELFLNGKSLGRKRKKPYQYRLRWDDVVYQPGELKVVAYRNAQPWAETTTATTGPASRLDLTPDRTQIRADGADLSFVTVRVVDSQGRLVPRSHQSVKYSLDGPGEIIAVGNGDPTNHESFQAKERKVFNGMALVIIRSLPGQPGELELSAESDELESAKLNIQAGQ
jgi:beta-galactosidase